jgi:hypothetical protein
LWLHNVLHDSVAKPIDAAVIVYLVRVKGLHDRIEELRDPRPFVE